MNVTAISIVDSREGGHLAAFRALAAEYGASIADVAACSLEHQGFADELRDLPGRYAPSRGGRLFIATVDGQPAGCIACGRCPRLAQAYAR